MYVVVCCCVCVGCPCGRCDNKDIQSVINDNNDAQQGGCVDSTRCGAFDHFEPGPFCAWVQHANHSATEPPRGDTMSKTATAPTRSPSEAGRCERQYGACSWRRVAVADPVALRCVALRARKQPAAVVLISHRADCKSTGWAKSGATDSWPQFCRILTDLKKSLEDSLVNFCSKMDITNPTAPFICC